VTSFGAHKILQHYNCIPCYVGPCHNDKVCPLVADGGDGLQIWRVAVKVLNNSLGQPIRGGPLAWNCATDKVLLTGNKEVVMKCYTGPRTWTDSLIGWEDVNWIHLAQDRDQWQGLS